jgi:integrase/recombinase XerD
MTPARIYDTQVDTQKMSLPMTNNFKIRTEVVNKYGLSPIYLHIVSMGKRERINIELHVKAKLWDDKKQQAKPVDKSHQDLNLILDHIKSKISDIKIRYRLENRVLTPTFLKEELIEGNHRIYFVSYMKFKIDEDKSLSPGTKRRYNAVANNLAAYRKELLFTDITEKFIEKYRNHMYSAGKLSTTINSNIIAIKRYLKLAKKKDGINIQVDLEDIAGGKTTGNRTALNPAEVRTLCKYYFDKRLEPKKQLTLGYFLFSCMTGLRVSDVMELDRRQLFTKDFNFVNVKTKKDQTIVLNKMAIKIVEFNPDLFIKKHHGNTMNEYLKRIMKNNRIDKDVSFHVARHTFATNFLRMDGKVEFLQKLMGHSKIETTMIYVHILQAEANEHIHKLDDLFHDFGFDLDLE